MCALRWCKPSRWPGEGLSRICWDFRSVHQSQAAMSDEQVERLMGAIWALFAKALGLL